MDMTGVMVILLVACLAVTSVLLGLAVGVLLMFRRQRTKAANRATESAEAVSEGPERRVESKLEGNHGRVSDQLNDLQKGVAVLGSQIAAMTRSSVFSFNFMVGFSGIALGAALIIYSTSTIFMFNMFSQLLSAIPDAPTPSLPSWVTGTLAGGIVAFVLGLLAMVLARNRR